MQKRPDVLPYGRQWIDDDDVQAVAAQLRSDWLTQGPTVAAFEAALQEITGAPHVVAVASGTAALHLAMVAAGVRSGDVGLTSDITFVASANAIRYAGGTARLVDIDPDTGLMALDSLERAVEAYRPKVIVPVDYAGSVVDLAEVQRIAARVGATVIEDAAHSLGATYQGDRAASCAHSDFAILSFHPVKHLTTGEGGAITTRSAELAARLRELRSHGITREPSKLTVNDGPWYYEQTELGFHYRLTDLQCALGVSQAKRFPQFLARRRAIAARYDRAFEGDSEVRPIGVPPGVASSYHLYVVRVPPGRRKALYLGLRERNVAAQVHYIPVHRQPDFQRHGVGADFANAERFYAGCLSLPMFPAMTDADVDYVVAAVHEALA